LSKEEIIKLFQLDKVSKKEILSQCIDFRFLPKKFGTKSKIDENLNIILEEAKRTYSPEEVYQELNGLFYINRWQMVSKKECNDVEILIIFSNIGNNKELVIDAVKNCGWFLVGEQDVKLNDGKWIILNFDPMYQEDVFDIVTLQGKLYHWTPLYALDSIMKDGLKPRTENKKGSHPERVYFLSGKLSVQTLYGIGKELCSNNGNPLNNGKYVLISVDTGDLKGVVFHYDPHTEQSFWTDKRIDPSLLHVDATYDFSKNA
jgi:hypothetical protein